MKLTKHDRETAKRLVDMFTERGLKLMNGIDGVRRSQRKGIRNEADRLYEAARLLDKIKDEPCL